jgi:hypothetical protein
MKYAIKPSSRYLDIPHSGKIMFFKDEKQLIEFFHTRMRLDLVSPNLKTEKYIWRMRNKPNDITDSEVLSVYSTLVSGNIDFPFLSWNRRVLKFVYDSIGNKKDKIWAMNKVLWRMRSLPFNWSLYEVVETKEGSVLQNLRWGNFWKKAKKENLFKDISLEYKIPDNT